MIPIHLPVLTIKLKNKQKDQEEAADQVCIVTYIYIDFIGKEFKKVWLRLNKK